MVVKKPEVKPVHVFTMLTAFWFAWLYTEITEYFDRVEYNKEIEAFMNRGGRFTHDDGEAIKAEINMLRRRLDAHFEHSAKFTEKIEQNERLLIDQNNRIIRLEDERLDDL
jgi:hypothetical protein